MQSCFAYQPLLRISLLALLLPLSLSCDSKNPLTDVAENYKTIVQTDLERSVSNSIYFSISFTILHKMETLSFTLHKLACKMETLGLSQTQRLASSVIHSIGCPCLCKTVSLDTLKCAGNMVRKRRQDEKKKLKRRINRLCRTQAFLSAMTECYEMMNSRVMDR
uniref:Interleukin-7 n=1 Tax=Mola mola TaxID=94237 RepID=A0A3Q3VU44_MOLML